MITNIVYNWLMRQSNRTIYTIMILGLAVFWYIILK